MSDREILAAISLNLLRIAKWHAEKPEDTRLICERHLQQCLQLASTLPPNRAATLLARLRPLSFDSKESSERRAERFLTQGVIIRQPDLIFRDSTQQKF